MAERADCCRFNVLGVGLSAIHRHQAVEVVLDALARRRRGYITVTGVHGVMEAQQDEAVRTAINNAFLCTPDGMPMVWIGKLKGHRQMSRVYGPDFMLDVCAVSARHGIRHFFFGGAPGVVEQLKERLTARFPGLEVVGTYTPPFRALNAEEQEQLRQLVEKTRPDIFWVGLSTPKQEKFMAEYLPKLNVPLMAGVGAAFDFHAGRVKQAPHWMQRVGLEWFFRLCQEPRRLWKRYLTNNPRFLWLMLGQALGFRKYRID